MIETKAKVLSNSKALTTNTKKKMSDNTLVFVAVIAFMAIFVIALGVVIVVLIVQCIKDRGKKKKSEKVSQTKEYSHISIFYILK